MSVIPLTKIESWEDLKQALLANLQSHFNVEEFASLVGRAPFSVREWCRLGRIHAEKSLTQAGPSATWVISATELERYRREGLLRRRSAEMSQPAQRGLRRRATT